MKRAQEMKSSRFGTGSMHSGCEAMKLLAFIHLVLGFAISSLKNDFQVQDPRLNLASKVDFSVAESVLIAESAASECLSHGTFLSSVEASQSFLLSFSVGGVTRKVRIQL